jgi:hypothetical protein
MGSPWLVQRCTAPTDPFERGRPVIASVETVNATSSATRAERPVLARAAGGDRTFGAIVRFEEYRLPRRFASRRAAGGRRDPHLRARRSARAREGPWSRDVRPSGRVPSGASTDAVPTKVSRTQSAHLFRAWLFRGRRHRDGEHASGPEDAAVQRSPAARAPLPSLRRMRETDRSCARGRGRALGDSRAGQHVHELVDSRIAWLHIVLVKSGWDPSS